MKRQALVPLEIVEHDGFFYATLDFVAPSKAHFNSQISYLELRPGWQLVPQHEDTVNQVVKPHKWGSSAVVFENGKAYQTANTRQPGEFIGNDCLMRSGNQFKPKKMLAVGDLRVLVRTAATAKTSDSPFHPESDCSNCSGLWKRRRFTDYMVICAGEQIPCHRAVLAEASPVFDRALDSQMREASNGSFEIKEAEPHSVHSMLAFMYTGKVEDEPIERIAALVALADRYGVETLVMACANQLLENLNPDRAITVTRALKGLKHKPEFEATWKALQNKLKENEELLSAVMDGV